MRGALAAPLAGARHTRAREFRKRPLALASSAVSYRGGGGGGGPGGGGGGAGAAAAGGAGAFAGGGGGGGGGAAYPARRGAHCAAIGTWLPLAYMHCV